MTHARKGEVHLHERQKKALRHVRFSVARSWADGVLAASQIASSYNWSSSHLYDLGDCILAKLNLLRPGLKIRKNPFAHACGR